MERQWNQGSHGTVIGVVSWYLVRTVLEVLYRDSKPEVNQVLRRLAMNNNIYYVLNRSDGQTLSHFLFLINGDPKHTHSR